MDIQIGDIVTRDELSEYVGAGGDGCFLHSQNMVVAIAMNPEMNPDAPEVLLVGKGPRKELYAAALLKSGDFVPTFIKRAPHQWEYMGDFKAEKIDQDAEVIDKHAKRSDRNDIWGVLSLVAQP